MPHRPRAPALPTMAASRSLPDSARRCSPTRSATRAISSLLPTACSMLTRGADGNDRNDTPPAGGFLVALQDTKGDGRADVIRRFGGSVQTGSAGGTGVALYRGGLFAEADD